LYKKPKPVSDMLGRGPRNVTASLQANTLVVQLEDVLTTAEEALVRTDRSNHARGIAMIREMRNNLVRQSRSRLLAELSDALGKQATGMMHDIDPESGSEVLVFRLADAPDSKPLA
jgi:uncharacterized protein YbcI